MNATASPRKSRPGLVTAAGVAIILLGAGAALLPFVDRISGVRLVGTLLLAAGIVEMSASTLREQTRFLALLAGAVTTLAGALFLINPVTHFLPTISIVTAWLILRSLILGVTTMRVHGSVRRWIAISAATDLALGLLLLVGLSISTLIVTLFGPTPEMVASFAWILAISFVVTGMLLLEIASCEREAAADE
ncbi:MAG: DUF308 domain-containing protein [Sphingomonas bacterium]|nr:DUF308 domain-containing protein [Sphingomonas bacterium]